MGALSVDKGMIRLLYATCLGSDWELCTVTRAIVKTCSLASKGGRDT
jgi:hypothetical protein